MLDPPGQRLKLPGSPSVEPRCLSQHCLGNMDIDERVSNFVIVNFVTERLRIISQIAHLWEVWRNLK